MKNEQSRTRGSQKIILHSVHAQEHYVNLYRYMLVPDLVCLLEECSEKVAMVARPLTAAPARSERLVLPVPRQWCRARTPSRPPSLYRYGAVDCSTRTLSWPRSNCWVACSGQSRGGFWQVPIDTETCRAAIRLRHNPGSVPERLRGGTTNLQSESAA